MKTKKMFLPLLALFLIYIPSLRSQEEQEIDNFQELTSILDNETPLQLNLRSLKPIFESKTNLRLAPHARPSVIESRTAQFNTSFVKYIKEVYNENGYAESLSQNASHIIYFLEFSNEINLDIETTCVCMRLFYNKLKAAELIDDTMLNQVMSPLSKNLDRFFYIKDEESKKLNLAFIKENLENVFAHKMSGPLSDFGSHILRDQILSCIKNEAERSEKEYGKSTSRERLRQIIIRFLELSLAKIMWNPTAPEGNWQSFIELANHLQLLGAYGIIDHMDDLDDLLWSLVHRFCFYLDFTGASLPLSFYEEVEQALKNKLVSFLESPEQDLGITTKKETLALALLKAKTRAYAYEKMGLLTL